MDEEKVDILDFIIEMLKYLFKFCDTVDPEEEKTVKDWTVLFNKWLTENMISKED